MKRFTALCSVLAALAIVPGAGAASGSLFGGAGHTITVGQPAVKAHLKHGDTMGACTAAQKKAAKKKHHK